MLFCYHNYSNVLCEKIVLVLGKKLCREFVMFLRFYFPRTRTIFPQLVRNIMVTDYFFVYSYFFQCEEKNGENFFGYGIIISIKNDFGPVKILLDMSKRGYQFGSGPKGILLP